MSKSTQDSPQSTVVAGIIGGVLFSGMFAYFYPPSPTENLPFIVVVVGNAVFALVVAIWYYLLFRGQVANSKLPEKERIKFAGLYFMWIGFIIGASATRFLFGGSLIEAVTSIVLAIVGLTISYRKLFRLYRAAGEGGPPQSPPS